MKKSPNSMLFWVILWSITPIIILVRNIIANKSYPENVIALIITLVVLVLPYTIVSIIGWFVYKFIYKVIFNTKIVSPKHVFITWLVIFLVLFFIPRFRKPKVSDQAQLPKQYSESLYILEAINDARAIKGLTTLKADENLCAYAKRRALQYKEQSPEKGELLPLEESQEVTTTYFKDFPKSTEAVMKVGLVSTKQTAEDFTEVENKGASIPLLTHGCVAEEGSTDGRGTWTVFIGGIKQ